jgi:hypothetical protein
VRLTYDGQHLEAPLVLNPDPRVTASAEALAQQLRLSMRLTDLITRSSQTLLTARSEEAQVQSIAPAMAASAASAFKARLAKLTGSAQAEATGSETAQAKPPAPVPGGVPPGAGAPQPSASPPNLKDLQEQISGLYAELTRGDAAPTAAQLAATDSLQGKLAPLLDDWQKLQAELPELNRQLRAAKLAPIRTDLAPPRDVNFADQE